MNAFEMRLQMIKMANDYLEKRYEHDLKIFNMKLENVGGDEIPKRP